MRTPQDAQDIGSKEVKEKVRSIFNQLNQVIQADGLLTL